MTAGENLHRHYAAHVAHQQKVWEDALSEEGFDAAIIHAGSQITSFMDDYHYPFRPNPHFLSWLPLTRHDESVLLVRPGQKPLLYFYQPDDYWYLPPADPESWWAGEFEVRPVQREDAWRDQAIEGRVASIGDSPQLAGAEHLNPPRLINRIHLQRTRKTDYEIACIMAASRIAVRGHRAAAAAFMDGASEFEIHQGYLQASRQEDAELPYANIVALNTHGAVLHYQQRERRAPSRSRSFLIDGGATQYAYCSDITRTYSAADDDFSALIDAMNSVQQSLCEAVCGGTDYRELHLRAHRQIAEVLKQFDLVRSTPEAAVETGLSGVFFPHGLGHFLGLQTHDVAGLIADVEGRMIERPEGHPYLRLTRTLEPGNVLTIEPGLYFIPSLLEKWRRNGQADVINWAQVDEFLPYGGIRIEDNVLVTEDAPRNLTRTAFSEQMP